MLCFSSKEIKLTFFARRESDKKVSNKDTTTADNDVLVSLMLTVNKLSSFGVSSQFANTALKVNNNATEATLMIFVLVTLKLTLS